MTNALCSIALLAICAWASNIWPGQHSWTRAALSRLLWWSVPFGIIVRLNGAPWDHVAWMMGAAWIGAWVPHVECPNVHIHLTELIADTIVLLMRVFMVLMPPMAVFYLCGASWFFLVIATVSVLPCVVAGNLLPPIGLGLRAPREIAGVMFGAEVGLFLTLAIVQPLHLPDLLN